MRSLLFLLFLFNVAKAAVESTHLSYEDYENYLYRDDKTSVQLLFTNPKAQSSIKPRLIVAFPAGNSGMLLYLKSATNDRLNYFQLVEGSLSSVNQLNGRVGISGQWNLSQNADVEAIVMGSVRSVRDYIDSGNPSVNLPTVVPNNNNKVTYYYNFIRSSYRQVILFIFKNH